MPGNLMTGIPVSGLMIFGLSLLDRMARKLTLLDTRGPRSGLHTIDWIEISNQKISETCMHGIVVLQRNSAVVTNLS